MFSDFITNFIVTHVIYFILQWQIKDIADILCPLFWFKKMAFLLLHTSCLVNTIYIYIYATFFLMYYFTNFEAGVQRYS